MTAKLSFLSAFGIRTIWPISLTLPRRTQVVGSLQLDSGFFSMVSTVPTVTATTPASPARSTANVTATFSEPVRGVTTGTMKLVLSGRTDPLSSVVTMSADKKKAFLNPAANLLRGRTYKAVLTSGVTDIARNPLVQKEWTFTVS